MAGKGGAREGAGRKTKAEILGLAKKLEDCITPEDESNMWIVIKNQALKGSLPHAQLYLAYKYGKPSEHIINETDQDTVIRIIRDGTTSSPQESPSSPESNTQGSQAV